MGRSKQHYYILYRGEYAGQTYARSEAEAVKNHWWRFVKEENPFTVRLYDPSDFEAISH